MIGRGINLIFEAFEEEYRAFLFVEISRIPQVSLLEPPRCPDEVTYARLPTSVVLVCLYSKYIDCENGGSGD